MEIYSDLKRFTRYSNQMLWLYLNEWPLFFILIQTCEIKYESFGYTTDQMRMQWMQDKNVLNPNITLDQFDPVITFPDNYQTDYYEHSFPGLILRMTLARKINYHLIQTYIPSR